jgi:hypothetical protein
MTIDRSRRQNCCRHLRSVGRLVVVVVVVTTAGFVDFRSQTNNSGQGPVRRALAIDNIRMYG